MTNESLRRVVRAVAILNLTYFGVEFAVGRAIGSVSLFADSIDFLEDASVNFLIVAAIGWTAPSRARIGMALAGILLVPGLAALWTAREKLHLPVAPDPTPLTLAGAGALAVNLSCAFMLARYRHHSGSLTKAAFLSARNDALANVARTGDSLHAVSMAGFDCWAGHRRDERRCCPRGLAGGTGRTPRRGLGPVRKLLNQLLRE
jgi:Co/Zn/Cd efflux system component